MRVSKFSAAAAVLASSLLLVSGATAATVVGAKSIHITKGGGPTDYMQISEVVALDFGNVDVALATEGGSASALNVYGPSHLPGLAIDGIHPLVDLELYLSAGTSGDYLDITFSHATTLASLSIYGRQYCCSDRDIFHFDILNASGDSLYSGILDASNSDHVGSVSFEPVSGGVPEPAAWTLMLAGFGGIGAAMRRRRSRLSCA